VTSSVRTNLDHRTDIMFDIFEPLSHTNADNVFVCKGYDATNHAKSIEGKFYCDNHDLQKTAFDTWCLR
jgi:hypothetical protein